MIVKASSYQATVHIDSECRKNKKIIPSSTTVFMNMPSEIHVRKNVRFSDEFSHEIEFEAAGNDLPYALEPSNSEVAFDYAQACMAAAYMHTNNHEQEQDEHNY